MALLLVLLAVLVAAPAAGAATFDVDVVADEADAGACTPSDTDCSLREAIIAANAAAGADVIRVPPETYTIASAPDGNGLAPARGDLDVTGVTTIERLGEGTVTIDGDQQDRVFDVTTSGALTLSDVRVVGGQGEAGIDGGLDGGGIRVDGSLTLNRVVMTGNSARRWGGAVAVQPGGSLQATDTRFVANEAGTRGGAINVSRNPPGDPAASVVLERSVVTANMLRDAFGEGGGIHGFASTLTVRSSEISDNTAGYGGGVHVSNASTVLVQSSTISGNQGTNANNVGGGGGVMFYGAVAATFEDSTIAANASALRAANLEHRSVASGADVPLVLRRTLIAGGRRLPSGSAPNCEIQAEVQLSSTRSLDDGTTCSFDDATDRSGVAAGLAPLGENGGPTRTHALGSGSPAIDAGGTGCPLTDQRGTGFPRPVGAACDIGAFEAVSTGAPDGDADGFPDATDNCPGLANADQANADGDAEGDACDADDDADGRADAADNCSLAANPAQEDTDRDGSGDACDADDDADGIADLRDNCRTTPNADQADVGRNGIGDVCEPSISGTVELDDNAADGALVVFCVPTSGCRQTTTDANGRFRFSGVAPGTYRLTASFGRSSQPVSDDVAVGAAGGAVHEFDLVTLGSPPDGTSVAGRVYRNGEIATISFREPFDLEHRACEGAKVEFKLLQGATVLRRGRMESTFEDATLFRATVQPLQPQHGYGTVQITVAGCPGGLGVVNFALYIDPSGWVRDLRGRPVAGATVRLYRSDLPAGPFGLVPDQSLIMSPANRTNPDVTDALGHFGWDVVPGFYAVQAEKAGCKAGPGALPGSATTVVTRVLEIPPPVLDLDLRLDCPYKPVLALGPLPRGTFAVAARTGQARYRLTNRSPFAITGTLVFSSGGRAVASRAFRLGANRAGTVKLRVRGAALQRLRRGGRVRVTAAVRARGEGGSRAAARRAIRLRRR